MQLRLRLLVLVTIATVSLCLSQDYQTVETVSSKARKQFESGKEAYKNKELERSIEHLERATSLAPSFIDAELLLAEVLFRSGQVESAISHMNTAMQLDSTYNVRSILALSRMLELTGDYASAASALKSYMLHADLASPKREALSESLSLLIFRDSMVNAPVPFEPAPVAGSINTSDDEALPAVSIDGNTMIFTRRAGRIENLYASRWTEGANRWGESVQVNRGTEYNEGAHAISANGNIMAFTACNRRDAVGSCDIYIMIKRPDGSWTDPVNMQAINTPAWEGQPAFSSDGRTLYFSSDRNGGMGKRDIWVSHFTQEGEWSTPANLGSPINTRGNESSPYLHYDDRTMYLMSDGHRGMGDYDIFLSRYSQGAWSTPENMGYPINTSLREGGLTVHPDSRTAYYTMQSDAGTMDIFSFDLPENLRPHTVSYLAGSVYDVKTEESIEASIVIYSLEDSTIKYDYYADASGQFDASLPHEMKYGIHVRSSGYAFHSEQYDLSGSEPYAKVELEIGLIPLTPEKDTTLSLPVVLNNVEFETGSAILLAESVQELNLLQEMLKNSPEINIEIRGHTDNVGDPDSNKQLSLARAQAVYTWLSNREIDEKRMRYEGFGQEIPIASNETEDGRQRNRRVEFIITN